MELNSQFSTIWSLLFNLSQVLKIRGGSRLFNCIKVQVRRVRNVSHGLVGVYTLLSASSLSAGPSLLIYLKLPFRILIKKVVLSYNLSPDFLIFIDFWVVLNNFGNHYSWNSRFKSTLTQQIVWFPGKKLRVAVWVSFTTVRIRYWIFHLL